MSLSLPSDAVFILGLFLLVAIVAAAVYVGAAGPRKVVRDIDGAVGAVFRRMAPRPPKSP
jgi:hypothetical protein